MGQFILDASSHRLEANQDILNIKYSKFPITCNYSVLKSIDLHYIEEQEIVCLIFDGRIKKSLFEM